MRHIRYTGPNARQRAERLQDALADLDGLPRCNHPKHGRTPEELAAYVRRRGRIIDCPCNDPSDPDPSCKVTTWDRVDVVEDVGDGAEEPGEPGVFYVRDAVRIDEIGRLPEQVRNELAAAPSVIRSKESRERERARGDRRRRGRRRGRRGGASR